MCTTLNQRWLRGLSSILSYFESLPFSHPFFPFTPFVAAELIQKSCRPSTGSQHQTMQKHQGNGVQSKQAVKPHKTSWLETKPGPDQGGQTLTSLTHTQSTEAQQAVVGSLYQSKTKSDKLNCGNYSMMKLKSQRRPTTSL